MLVLSRHRDESIIIGDNIVITVVDVRGDKVRLGIDAPRIYPCIGKRFTRRFSESVNMEVLHRRMAADYISSRISTRPHRLNSMSTSWNICLPTFLALCVVGIGRDPGLSETI